MDVAVPARETVAARTPQAVAATWVVVPTYNERAALPALVAGVLATLGPVRGPDGTRLLVVDDDSPDGTGHLADELAWADDRVGVLHRSVKTGLGDAYVAGFTAALRAGADRIVQMDADGSHDPAAIPALLAALDDGADLALGSRYVPGGATPDWPLARRMLSRAGCAYARTLQIGRAHV